MDGNAENVWEERTISIMWSVTLSFNEISFQKKKSHQATAVFCSQMKKKRAWNTELLLTIPVLFVVELNSSSSQSQVDCSQLQLKLLSE